MVGSGCAAMLAASRLSNLGVDLAIVNPASEFGAGDLRAGSGTGLWNAACRALDPGHQGGKYSGAAGAAAKSAARAIPKKTPALPEIYDRVVGRLREIFPASIERTGLSKGECWSILSSTPVYRKKTEELEREFFRFEKHAFSSGHYRLVNAESVGALAKRFGIDLAAVAQVDGAVQRTYAIHWDAVEMAYHLAAHVFRKFPDRCFVGAEIESRAGKRLILATPDGESVLVEADRAVLVLLTGQILPELRHLIASCDEQWLRGVRKRRRERHFAWFEKDRRTGVGDRAASAPGLAGEAVWLELGSTHYLWGASRGYASWSSGRGPDGLDRVVDEGLRLHRFPAPASRFVRTEREFWMEWDWKAPTWRRTRHDTYWGTAFEGDLAAVLELVWNLPI